MINLNLYYLQTVIKNKRKEISRNGSPKMDDGAAVVQERHRKKSSFLLRNPSKRPIMNNRVVSHLGLNRIKNWGLIFVKIRGSPMMVM